MRVRELQSEFDKLEDRVRAESAQKADLQVSQEQDLLSTADPLPDISVSGC